MNKYMEKEYTITDDKFLEAKKLINSNGGTIYTDGNFEIKGVEGKFYRDKNILRVLITRKPWLASWDMISNKMDGFFN